MNIIITGAGKGLALELTRLHAQKGDNVFALAHSITDDLTNIANNYDNVKTHIIELANENEIKDFLAGLEDDSIDMIYNVAGIWYEEQAVGIEETDIDITMQMYKVNSIAPLCVMKYSKRLLKENAVVVNVSSEAGSIGACHRDKDYSYCMSKAALNMASVIFQNETKDKNIKVFCYHPGWLRTQMGGARAKASPESISAEESATALLSLVVNKNQPVSSMFFDYKNEEWPW